MNRRSFLSLSGGVFAAGALQIPYGRLSAQGAGGLVVETASGRVRGLAEKGVQAFKGVPYGAATSGSARFMLPAKPQPWTGVRDAVAYSARAPQPFRAMVPGIGDALTGVGPMSEDCLHLNVWTPGATRGARRPVMVWFHGGGQRTGSGDSPFYEGADLARAGDVVVVTVKHRLNVFGNLYLTELIGGRYAQTSNLGLLDLVQALEWVRDNIDAFGGNPGNVTIFGQSGGGGKTALLHGVPKAKGLFHKAIIMSTLADTAISALEPNEANEASERFLSRIGVTKANADKLQQMSQEEILTALTGGGAAGGQGGNVGSAADLSLRIVPVRDGRTLTVHPFEPVASPLAEGVPLMCGANETEGIPYANPDDAFWKGEITTDAELKARVKAIIASGDADVDRVIALYRKNRPNYAHQDLALAIAGENTPLRTSAFTIAERKFAQGKAPVYMYFFRWRSPINKGKLRSMHTMELPFVFNHPENTPFMTGTGAEQRKLAEEMSAAWAAFARTGKPDAKGLTWPAFDPTLRATMVFNTESKAVNDPFGEERRTMQALRERPRSR